MQINTNILASLGAALLLSSLGSTQAQSPSQPQYPQAPYAQPPQAQYAQPPQAPYGQPPQVQNAQPPQAQYGQPPQVQYAQPPQYPQAQYGGAPQVQYSQAPSPPVAYAQLAAENPAVSVPGPIPEGAFQLGLSTPIMLYKSQSVDYEDDGPEFDYSELYWGLAQNPVSVELGYGLSSSVVLGALFGVGGVSQKFEQAGEADEDTDSLAFSVGPKLDFMFTPGSRVTPFLGAIVLVGIESYDRGDGVEASETRFNFLGRIGLRAFLAEHFSVDPALVVGGAIGSGSNKEPGMETDYDMSGFQIGLNIGISGWLR